jgi:hypothetical protein
MNHNTTIESLVNDINQLDETLAGLVADASEAAMRNGEMEAMHFANERVMLHLNSQSVNTNRLGRLYKLLETWQQVIRQQLAN